MQRLIDARKNILQIHVRDDPSAPFFRHWRSPLDVERLRPRTLAGVPSCCPPQASGETASRTAFRSVEQRADSRRQLRIGFNRGIGNEGPVSTSSVTIYV